MNRLEILTLPLEAQKAVIFVKHIRQHLGRRFSIFPERIEVRSSIPQGKVGCTICHRSVDEIYQEWRGK